MLRILLLLSFFLVEAVRADVDLADISLPAGFSIEIYADVPNARSLALG